MSYIDRVSHIHKQKRRVTDMTNKNIYQNIAARTGGDIYLGVVGPGQNRKSYVNSSVFMDLDGAAPHGGVGRQTADD